MNPNYLHKFVENLSYKSIQHIGRSKALQELKFSIEAEGHHSF